MPTIQRPIDWHYTPEAWNAFVDVLRLRYAQERRTLRLSDAWLVITLFFMAIVWALLKEAGGLRNYAIMGFVCATLWILMTWQRSAYHRRLLARVRNSPRVQIDTSGLHVGSVYTPWGIQSLFLRRISILAVNPILLQFTVRSIRMNGNWTVRLPAIAPVPIGKEGEAKQLMDELCFPWEMALPSPAQAAARGARRWPWWQIMLGTALFGGILFFIDFKVDGVSSSSVIGFALVIAALLAWVVSSGAAVCAIVVFIQAVWRRRRPG